MATSYVGEEKTKHYEGGLISLRLSKITYMENSKKMIKIDTGTNSMTIKFLSAEDKNAWVLTLKEAVSWVEETNS